MVVYVDIVFIENVILNFIIIVSTAIFSKSKINYLRILIASSLGSIYTIINYFVDISLFFDFISKAIISVCMVRISFRLKRIKEIFRQILFFYMTSLTFGGSAFAVLFFLRCGNVTFVKNYLDGEYSIKVLIIGGLLGFLIIGATSYFIRKKFRMKLLIYEVEIFNKGNAKKIKALVDTGNLLKDPVSKKDVIIVEKESLYELVDKELLENLNIIIKGKWIEAYNMENLKIRLIPYSSLGNENGMLIGFNPDYVKVYFEGNEKILDVVIAIYDGKLSKNNLYTCLVGANILDMEENVNELV